MQATLFMGGFLPPPAAFTLMLIRQYRLGAWLTANRDKTTFVQWVIRNLHHPNIASHVRATPVGQWVVSGELLACARKPSIQLHQRYIGTGRALVFALPRHPAIQRGEFFAQLKPAFHAKHQIPNVLFMPPQDQ